MQIEIDLFLGKSAPQKKACFLHKMLVDSGADGSDYKGVDEDVDEDFNSGANPAQDVPPDVLLAVQTLRGGAPPLALPTTRVREWKRQRELLEPTALVGAKPAKRRASAARAYHDLADTPAPDAGAQRAAAHRDATQSRSTGDSQMLLAAMIGSMVCIVLTVVVVLPLVLTKHL